MSSTVIKSLAERSVVEEHERYVEIYKITCTVNNKAYVGQAVSHILNRGKYKRYGMEKRLLCHISEAFSKKKNQCHYLNNSIRKYGATEFNVVLLELCTIENSEDRETFYIQTLNTMFPNGYNLKLGTATTFLSLEGRRRVSKGLQKYYSDQKFDRFKDVKIDIDKPIDYYIRPLRRNNEQYGWYVYINGCKADFGGIHISNDDSYEMAKTFINILIARHLVAGTPVNS